MIRKNKGTLLDSSKEIGLDINTKKIKYTFMSCHWNAGHNQNS